MARKIFAYGMDGLITPMMKYFAKEGVLPTFQRMLDGGTVNQTLPSFPVWTPTNWATLSTGAHTGTHSVTRWRVQLPSGTRINSFDGRANNAERIWNALERQGLKGVAVHYPAAHPSGVQSGFVVDGFGHPGHASTDYEIAAGQAYTTTAQEEETVQMDHDGTAVRRKQRSIEPIPAFQSAEGWSNLPNSQSPPLESVIEVHARLGDDVNTFYLLALDGSGNGYDRVQIYTAKDGNTNIAQSCLGEWSDWAIETFQIEGRDQRASVRFKLLELNTDGSGLKLYRTQVTYTDGFTYPDELAAELIDRFGPYQEHASMTPYTSGMTDFDTALEECEYQGLWFADVANYILHEKDCNLFYCHWHLYDYLNHIHLNDVDPVCPGYDPNTADEALDLFRKAYIVGDRVLQRIWDAADSETYVGVLADHGASPDVRIANIRLFLHEQGFTALKEGATGVEEDQVLEKDIDWENTTAYMKDDKGFDIFIHAEPGPKFDEIERKLLLTLRTWVDEQVGRNPIAIALPNRDAYLLGQWGDQCGDVIFAWEHGYVSGYYGQWKSIVGGGSVGAPEVFGAHHGGFIPTQSDISSSYGSFFLAGPGLKKGYERPTDKLGYIHAADVVPTLCHILDIDPPAQTQGAIAYDLFEGHEMVREREG
ncbi:MAG: alkaline phosphatase family protein [bacterium]|nr:alkaline phosphatase family protein [bacterium]